MKLPYDPATAPMGISSREIKMYIHMQTYTKFFIAVLLITELEASTMVHPYHGIQFREKKKKIWTIDIHDNLYVSPENYTV